MLRKSILVLATDVAVGATVAHSSSAFEGGRRSGFWPWRAYERGNRGSAHGGSFGSGERMSSGHWRSGRCDGLVGGTFAWPYCDYCTRHPGDQNC